MKIRVATAAAAVTGAATAGLAPLPRLFDASNGWCLSSGPAGDVIFSKRR